MALMASGTVYASVVSANHIGPDIAIESFVLAAAGRRHLARHAATG